MMFQAAPFATELLSKNNINIMNPSLGIHFFWLFLGELNRAKYAVLRLIYGNIGMSLTL